MAALAPAGGVSPPASTQAACRAAPSATYSLGGGTSTGTPRTAGAIRRTAPERGPPPTRNNPRPAAPPGGGPRPRREPPAAPPPPRRPRPRVRRRGRTAGPRRRPAPGAPV